MIYVAVAPTVGMVVFGVLWLRTLGELHRLEAERDDDWDIRHGIEPSR